MFNTLTYSGLGFCLLILTTCVFKSPSYNNAPDEYFATSVTINNRYPVIAIPISRLGNSLLKLNVVDQYNPSCAPMQVVVRVGLGESMKLIGRFSPFPINKNSDLVLDIAPYSDALCSGKTRDFEVGLMQYPVSKDSFSMTINIRRVIENGNPKQ